MKLIQRLEERAIEHENRARGLRHAIAEIHDMAKGNGHSLVKAAANIRKHAKNGHGNGNGHHHVHVQVRPGKGMTSAINEFLAKHPHSTVQETWDGIQGNFTSKSTNPRALLNVMMRNMVKTKFLARKGDHYTVTEKVK